jgi:hypothetical protein
MPVIIQEGLEIFRVQPDVACKPGICHPEQGVGRIKSVFFYKMYGILNDYIDGNALAGIVGHAFPDAQVTWFKEAGINSFLSQNSNQKTG